MFRFHIFHVYMQPIFLISTQRAIFPVQSQNKTPPISKFPIGSMLSCSSHAYHGTVEFTLPFTPLLLSQDDIKDLCSFIFTNSSVFECVCLSNLAYWYYISVLFTSPNMSQPNVFVLRKSPLIFNKRHIKHWQFPWLSAGCLRITLCIYRDRMKERWEQLGSLSVIHVLWK